jgi:hypothetical protein
MTFQAIATYLIFHPMPNAYASCRAFFSRAARFERRASIAIPASADLRYRRNGYRPN